MQNPLLFYDLEISGIFQCLHSNTSYFLLSKEENGGDILKVLRLSESCDLSNDEKYWYIFNHDTSKLYRIMKTSRCDDLFRNLREKRVCSTSETSSLFDSLIRERVLKETQEESFDSSYKRISERQRLYITHLRNHNADITYGQYAAKLYKSHVVIIGCGAIGSYLSLFLAATDIGKLTIIDKDIVEDSNLIRQIFYAENDIGKSKVDVLKKRVNSINRRTKVNAVCEFIDSCNARQIIPQCDIIVQTADKPKIVIDLIVEGVSNIKKIPSIYTHRDTVGPLYIPDKSTPYSKFLKKINTDTNGIFFKYVRSIDKYGASKYPAIAHGPLKVVDLLFDEVLSFVTGYKEPSSINNIIQIEGLKSNKIKV